MGTAVCTRIPDPAAPAHEEDNDLVVLTERIARPNNTPVETINQSFDLHFGEQLELFQKQLDPLSDYHVSTLSELFSSYSSVTPTINTNQSGALPEFDPTQPGAQLDRFALGTIFQDKIYG